MKTAMNSMERVLTTLGMQEPDRIPLFLLLSLHGARELGLTLKEYFSRPANAPEAQLRMKEKYNNDVLLPLYYAAMEIEAWGGEVIHRDDGPANSGEPPIRIRDIDGLEAPDVLTAPALRNTLESLRLLKEKSGDQALILGVTIAPLSLPVMQLGFENYLTLMFEDKVRFRKLMALNEAYSAAWAKAQINAGAHAIVYFDPVSSPVIIPKDVYVSHGHPVASRVISGMKAAVALHLASAPVLPILEEIIATGAKISSISCDEDLAEAKRAAGGRITLLGNLNGIEMRRWTDAEAAEKTKEACIKGGPGGGFILSDAHGEIPFQVPESTLLSISRAAQEYGRYPIIHDR